MLADELLKESLEIIAIYRSAHGPFARGADQAKAYRQKVEAYLEEFGEETPVVEAATPGIEAGGQSDPWTELELEVYNRIRAAFVEAQYTSIKVQLSKVLGALLSSPTIRRDLTNQLQYVRQENILGSLQNTILLTRILAWTERLERRGAA